MCEYCLEAYPKDKGRCRLYAGQWDGDRCWARCEGSIAVSPCNRPAPTGIGLCEMHYIKIVGPKAPQPGGPTQLLVQV